MGQLQTEVKFPPLLSSGGFDIQIKLWENIYKLHFLHRWKCGVRHGLATNTNKETRQYETLRNVTVTDQIQTPWACLSSGCCQNTVFWVALIYTTEICWKFKVRMPAWPRRGLSCRGQLLLVSVHGREQSREASSLVTLMRALIPS